MGQRVSTDDHASAEGGRSVLAVCAVALVRAGDGWRIKRNTYEPLA